MDDEWDMCIVVSTPECRCRHHDFMGSFLPPGVNAFLDIICILQIIKLAMKHGGKMVSQVNEGNKDESMLICSECASMFSPQVVNHLENAGCGLKATFDELELRAIGGRGADDLEI